MIASLAKSALVFQAVLSTFSSFTNAQQYAGDTIANSLPTFPGAEVAYFKVASPDKTTNVNLTLTNYVSLNSTGGRPVASKLQRAVIVIHGLQRDPSNYMSYAASALSQVANRNTINKDTVVIVAPYFPNGNDKNSGYPWTDGLKPGRGSTTSALVWSGSNWADGANNQYPYNKLTVSSYEAVDQLIKYYDNKALFPNMKQIVIGGHSLGSQFINRYVAVGNVLNTVSPVSYYIANPNSYLWFAADRPIWKDDCATYDDWRDGLSSYTNSYGADLIASGRDAVLARYNSRTINYARGLLDTGDDSSSCAPATIGANRNERFFAMIKAFPATTGDTIDYLQIGHDGGSMFASASGQARLFTDNFNGDGSRAYDIGYPRQQTGDNPYPDPSQSSTVIGVPSGPFSGMTYQGCYTDLGSNPTLSYIAYQGRSDATVETCTATCSAAGYSIAGASFGNQCFCGNKLGYKSTKVVEEACQTPCAGNANEICGNGLRLSLFSTGTPTQASIPKNPPTVGTYVFQGCYTDNNTVIRTLSSSATAGSKVDLQSCATFCAAYTYFGAEYADECYCGNAIMGGNTLVATSDCGMICANNDSEFCGAGNRMTIYKRDGAAQSSVASSSGTPASSTVSSSTLSASSTSTALACPGSDGTLYKAASGKSYKVECGIDHAGGDLSMVYTAGLQSCIDACDATATCVAYSWVYGGSATMPCYLKSAIGASTANSGIWGGSFVAAASNSSSTISSTVPATSSTAPATSSTTSVTSSAVSTSPTALACPASDGTVYKTSSGKTYKVECGIDHAAGDLSMAYTPSLESCIDICGSTDTCVAYSWVNGAGLQPCYLKSTIGAANPNAGIWGGKFVEVIAPTSSISASSSSSSPTLISSSVSSITSTSSSVTSATSTSSIIASALPTVLTCPGSDGSIYKAASGKTYKVECSVDHAGGDLSVTDTPSLKACIDTCDATIGCVSWSWVSSGTACYLKSSVGASNVNSDIWGGKFVAADSVATVSASASVTSISSTTVSSTTTSSTSSSTILTTSSTASSNTSSTSTSLAPTTFSTLTSLSTSITTSTSSSTGSSLPSSTVTSLSCPTNDGQTYTASSGKNYKILCGVDHAGGDLALQYTLNFLACVKLCDSTAGCVSWSYRSGAADGSGPCFMKSSIGAVVADSGIWGGTVIV